MSSKGKIAVIGGLGALILVGILFIKVQAQKKPFELSDEANRALVSSNYDTSGEPVLLRYASEIGQETHLTYRFNINAHVPQMGPVDAKMKMVVKERVVAVHEDIETISIDSRTSSLIFLARTSPSTSVEKPKMFFKT